MRSGVGFSSDAALRFAGFLRCHNRTIMKLFLKKNRSGILRKFRGMFLQISCQFASDFFEKRLHYCTTIALQKSCDKPANRRAASDEKPTPGGTSIPFAGLLARRVDDSNCNSLSPTSENRQEPKN